MEKENKNRKLPLFRGFVEKEKDIIDGQEMAVGVNAVGFVDHPATDFAFLAFNEAKQLSFSLNKERKIVSGIAMVANQPIYRNDNGFEYFIEFDKEDIFKIIKFYFKNKNTDKVNLMHNENMMQEDVYLIESLWIDKERGISVPEMFGKPTDGSWFMSFAVDNVDAWENWIKSGKVTGFSVEGIFKQYQIDQKSAQTLENLHNRIAELRKNFEVLKQSKSV